MTISYLRLRFFVALTFGLLMIVVSANAADTDEDGRRYQPSADTLSDVQEALNRAEKSDQLLLIVLGANWCHDSRALASRLYNPPLAELIQRHYQLVFVDVGFLDQGREVVQRFDIPHYYATPTVLIIDPSSGQVINEEDRHQWGNAYNIDMSASVDYFRKWLDRGSSAIVVTDSAELSRLLAEIDEFEQYLAQRVANGYAVVGPMLEAYEAADAPEEFGANWKELREFRTAIPGDIYELRDFVRRRVTAGEKDARILFPTYPPLSWESEY